MRLKLFVKFILDFKLDLLGFKPGFQESFFFQKTADIFLQITPKSVIIHIQI